ncbi:uncharacterized protein TNCV_3078001 [Trichonephila clavipes]|nr:uncharacterized protein TNCV_3078001 [Trichonephila clavipes]
MLEAKNYYTELLFETWGASGRAFVVAMLLIGMEDVILSKRPNSSLTETDILIFRGVGSDRPLTKVSKHVKLVDRLSWWPCFYLIINVSLNKPSEIKLADYKFNIPGKIDVLLGAEIFYELLRPGQIYCGDSLLLLQNTVFGYVVSGSVGDEVRGNNIHCGLIRDSDLNTTLKSFRELKSIGVKNENCNCEEDVSLGVFKQRVLFKNDRYGVELPRKRDSDELSDNFNLEKGQLGSPKRKMLGDKVLYSEYCTVFRNYLDDGIIEKVTNPFISTNGPVLYFPHQVMIKNESLTTKQQTTFVASACERRVLKEEMGSEKSDEDTELPQVTERVIPLESERAKMLSVGPKVFT